MLIVALKIGREKNQIFFNREAAKKNFSDSPLKGGGERLSTKEKKLVLSVVFVLFVAVLLTTALSRGRGLKALVDSPLKKDLFCGFPYRLQNLLMLLLFLA